MEKWELFENECANYLNDKYKNYGISFIARGGHDSNTSDIQVNKNGIHIYYIECKMSVAQCGQFVLFMDDKNKRFIFSNRNKTPFDDYAKRIINEMDKKYELCKVSRLNDLPISESTISQWVKNFYLNHKKSKYCITKSDTEYIIFPIEEMDKYFEFRAKYRPKNSGSAKPSKTNLRDIEEALKSIGIDSPVQLTKTNCYAEFSSYKDKFVLSGNKYRYQFTQNNNRYDIRRLSNTRNANFIVSIKLKTTKQNRNDLLKFEKTLIK